MRVAETEIRMVPAVLVRSVVERVARTESVIVAPCISELLLPVLAATPAEILAPRVVTYPVTRGKGANGK